MSSGLSRAISSFSEGQWAKEPPVDVRNPTDPEVARGMRSLLGKLRPFAAARFLLIFFIGVAATLAWQSYGGAAKETIARWSPRLGWLAPQPAPVASPDQLRAVSRGLAVARQSVDKLAADITKLQTSMQETLDKTSARPPSQQPAAASGRKPCRGHRRRRRRRLCFLGSGNCPTIGSPCLSG